MRSQRKLEKVKEKVKTAKPGEESALHTAEFLLLTGRTIYQGVGKETGKLSDEYLNSVATCEMDPVDMRLMRIRENSSVRVTTRTGSVIVKAVKSMRAPHAKTLFMPCGPWTSLIMDAETDGTGMPSLKGVPARVEAAPEEKILSIPELLKAYYGEE